MSGLLLHSKLLTCITAIILSISVSNSATYLLPSDGDIIGEMYETYLEPGQSVSELARLHKMGYNEIIAANPHLKQPRSKIPNWSTVIIPSQFVLPATKRQGIVVNLPELRLYFYPKDSDLVLTFPIAVGRIGWKTPIVETKIINKRKDPTWRVPKSIQIYMKNKGIDLPNVVPPGPNNPLGQYALSLQKSGYLIHGTNQPYSIGKRSSSGCIRMYPEDIEKLYSLVEGNEKVMIINQPFKAGMKSQALYLESHQPFRDQMPDDPNYDEVQDIIPTSNSFDKLDWEQINRITNTARGYPQQILLKK